MKKSLLLLIICLLISACCTPCRTTRSKWDTWTDGLSLTKAINVDLDSNDKLDLAYGGTNAASVAAALAAVDLTVSSGTWDLSSLTALTLRSFTMTASDDGYVYFDPATASESEWYIGPNHDSGGDDDDPMEFRQSATAGTNVRARLNKDGSFQSGKKFYSYDAAQTLTEAVHNNTIVQMTVADEITLWDCTANNLGSNVILRSRDGEAIEVNPASGDQFYLLNGTGCGANDTLDTAATAGATTELVCIAADEWRVIRESHTSSDGGAQD